MKSIIIAVFILGSVPAFAQGRALTLMDYFGSNVRAGDVVCEAVARENGQISCYVTVGETTVLTDGSDPTGMLQKGTVTPEQRQFTQVYVGQILAELDRGKVRTEAPIDVYVKVAWKARDNGPLAKTLVGNHIVHGRLTLAQSGAFQFEVLNIPDMILLGIYNPSLDVAEVFGRRIGDQNAEIETDMKLWLEAVLSKVVPAALVTVPSRH